MLATSAGLSPLRVREAYPKMDSPTPKKEPEVPEVEISATEPKEEVKKYDFNEFFQRKIAALILRDMMFVQRTDGLIKPEYFEHLADATLVDMALNYYKKYRRIPADKTIYATLIREGVINKTMKKEVAALVSTRIKDLLTEDLSDRDFVIDEVAIFARHQAVCKAIEHSIKHLDKRDFDQIQNKLKNALDVGANMDVGEYDFHKEISSRTGERLERAAGILPPTGVTTGYPAIDAMLYHKGWGLRELSVIMGGAKAGKTTAMIDFGLNALAAKYNVLYITLEVSARIIAERMDSNISQRIINELGEHVHDVRQKVNDFMARAVRGDGTQSRFVIHEFPSGNMTTSDLRRLIERYKSKGLKFDLVIVDYADLMAPEHRTDSSVENSKSVYVHLRGLAMQENIAVLTATQTNREGFKATVAKAEHVSEDFNKIRIADLVISINRTDEERTLSQARLFFAASRNQAGGITVRVEQALDRMKFINKILGSE